VTSYGKGAFGRLSGGLFFFSMLLGFFPFLKVFPMFPHSVCGSYFDFLLIRRVYGVLKSFVLGFSSRFTRTCPFRERLNPSELEIGRATLFAEYQFLQSFPRCRDIFLPPLSFHCTSFILFRRDMLGFLSG